MSYIDASILYIASLILNHLIPLVNQQHQIDNWMKDGVYANKKDKFVLVRKVLITVCARELHLLMSKPVSETGFDGAYEKDNIGRVRFSENTLHLLLSKLA